MTLPTEYFTGAVKARTLTVPIEETPLAIYAVTFDAAASESSGFIRRCLPAFLAVVFPSPVQARMRSAANSATILRPVVVRSGHVSHCPARRGDGR